MKTQLASHEFVCFNLTDHCVFEIGYNLRVCAKINTHCSEWRGGVSSPEFAAANGFGCRYCVGRWPQTVPFVDVKKNKQK